MRPGIVVTFAALAVATVAFREAHPPDAAYAVAAGLFLAVIGGWGVRGQLRLRRHGIRVVGTVIGMREAWVAGPDAGQPGSPSYRPVVRFRTPSGQEIVTATRVGTPGGLAVGRAVPIRYDPRRPTSAEIDSFRERGLLNLLAAALLVGGLALAVAGAAHLLR
jgi:hypothetical protein